ncbi:MAG: PAS domain S-box protein [Chloroflexaceae bacterium]|nr:PAS domain S-box protein [Chloroflexaceae bacterium]
MISSYTETEEIGRLRQRVAQLEAEVQRLRVEPAQQATQAIPLDETLFRSVFELSHVGIAVTSTEGKLVLTNRAFQALVGYTHDELAQMSTNDITHPDDIVPEQTFIQAIVGGKRDSYTLEKRYIHKNRRIIWVCVHCWLLHKSTDYPQLRITSVEEIGTRRSTEQALASSERFKQGILDALSSHIAVLDKQGTIITVNQAWRDFAESNPPVSNNIAEGANYLEVCDNADGECSEEAATFAQGLRSVLKRERDTFLLEYPCHSPDKERWFIGHITRMVHPDGIYVVVSHEDITERKLAERRLKRTYYEMEQLNHDLQQSRNLFRSLFDGLQDGLVLLDHEGTIQIVNRTLATLFDSTPDELIGRPWHMLVTHLVPIASESAHCPNSCPQRCRYETSDGRTRILEMQRIPLEASGMAHAEQCIVLVTDITEHLQLQARVIENERFAANGRLAASVAHEINTPLQSLDFSLEMAQIAPGRERHVCLQEARVEIQRIARIVHQLLDLYRPNATRYTTVYMNVLIERVLLLIGKWMRDQGIVIECALHPSLPKLMGRSDELMQVLLNLMMNAVQAMPDGGLLRIKTAMHQQHPLLNKTSEPYEGPWITIACIDNGCGIDPVLHNRIFDPFFTTNSEGTGLGLAISKQIITQYHGNIHVESSVGMGSTFTVTLPVHPLSEEKAS